MRTTKPEFLHNKCEPSCTGMGLTKTQIRFFKKPRNMSEIIDLFNGDQWEANHFQTKHVLSNVLYLNTNATFELVDWDNIRLTDEA